MMKTTIKNRYILYLKCTLIEIIPCVFMLLFTGCKKFVDVGEPKSLVLSSSVFEDQATARAATTAMYAYIAGNISVQLAEYSGWYADEFIPYNYSALSIALYKNSLDGVVNTPSEFWAICYQVVYMANAIIEGCEKSKSLSEADKKQFIGEAKFTRAWMYSQLTNLYGSLPLVLSTDYQVNSALGRLPQTDIYDQIIKDLNDARNLVSAYYVGAQNTQTDDRVRPNIGAVDALLSRVLLYKGDFQASEEAATRVIGNHNLYDTVEVNKVFFKNSREAIWQLGAATNSSNETTSEARDFILYKVPDKQSLSMSLVNAFEAGDLRAKEWVGSFIDPASGRTYYYPFKYKDRQVKPARELSTVLRLGETYLNRAEARAGRSNLEGAKADLNIIRMRAGLLETKANSKDEILRAILNERRMELFTEYGHRWSDIQRNALCDEIMKETQAFKGLNNWQTYKRYWPVAQTEIGRSKNLKQTAGYE